MSKVTSVVIIADCDPRKQVAGGVGVYSYHLVKYLSGKGLEVIFFGKTEQGKIVTRFSNFTFIPVTEKPGESNFSFLRKLFRKAKNAHILDDAVIHSQRPDWMLPFLDRTNRKIVTLHGCHTKNVHLKKGYLLGKGYLFLEKKALAGSDLIISVSAENAEHYRKVYTKYPSILKKLKVIPVGINTAQFGKTQKEEARKQFGLPLDKKLVLYIGRLEKEKNLKMLIGGCRAASLGLVLAGSGRDEEELRSFARQLKADVVFIGKISNESVPSLLATGDVFALTSLYEGLPTLVLEALAAGLPVISTRVGDVPEVVQDGKTGFIIDAKDIAEKLKYAGKHSAKFKESCMKAAAAYDWTLIGKRILEDYHG